MRKLIFVILALINSCLVYGQDIQDIIKDIELQPNKIVDTLDRNYDNREIKPKYYKEELSKIYDSAEFEYQRVQGSDSNIFRRFLSWVLEGLRDLFGFEISPLTAKIIEYTFYALIIGVVLYFSIRFLGTEKPSSLLGKSRSSDGPSVSLEDTHITDIDFNTLIKDSIAAADYRSAIRYQYLLALKMLSERGIIEWDFQKTNSEYYREIQDQEKKTYFKRVSNWYDYVWYGEFSIDQSNYEKALEDFNLLKKASA